MTTAESPRPTVGRIVHYVSHGTPFRLDGSQAFTSTCRAALVTEVPYADDPELAESVSLAVINPTGLFFHSGVPHQPVDPDASAAGGTWHWPERG